MMVLIGNAAVFAMALLFVEGSPWVAFAPVIISPVAALIIRLTLEGGQPGGMLNWRTQSWAFLFGDSLALPAAFYFAVLGWRAIVSQEGFHHMWWWLFVALAAAAIVVWIWRSLEVEGYINAGYAALLDSPTKLWHDYVVYGSLSFGLVWGGVPVILKDFGGAGRWVLVAVAVWGLLGIADGFRGLNPADLHPPVQNTILRT